MSHSVSPVVVSFRPITATIWPAPTDAISCTLVRVHLVDLADPFLASLGRVQHRRARLELARVDADVGQSAQVRVGRDLVRQRRERIWSHPGAARS